MNKTRVAPALSILIASVSIAAQSGRRVGPQPAPAEVSAPAAATAPAVAATSPAAATGLAFIPEGVLARELRTLKDEPFRLADYGGRVVVLNLWATWCGPCRREMPEFERVRKDYAAHGVEFVALTTENPETEADKVRKFVSDYRIGARVGWVDRATARVLMNGRNVIPQTIVVAGDGRVVRHMRGYGPGSADGLREAIDRALYR